MKRAERVAALEALLARVQANAASPRGADVDELGTRGAAAAPSGVVDRAPAPAASPTEPTAPVRPADLGDWSSLLERDLRDPSPPSPPPPPAHAAFALAAARLPSQPPPPPASTPPAGAAHAAAAPTAASVSQPQAASSPTHDEGPVSELERAIRAAAAAGPTGLEPHDLWTEAASDLRGRRSLEPTPAAAAPPSADGLAAVRSSRGPAASSGAAAMASPSTSPGAHAVEAHRRARRERRDGRRRTPRVPLLAGAVVAAAALTWILADRPGRSEHALPAAPPAIERSTSAPRPAASAAQIARADVPPPPSSSAHPPAPPDARSAEVAPAPEPPPTIRRPADHGLLRVEADQQVDVYLQGVRAGGSGRWLEVPCGVRNARLARPGAPPPGHSFPMWLGTGRTVVVPCGSAHTLRWTLD